MTVSSLKNLHNNSSIRNCSILLGSSEILKSEALLVLRGAGVVLYG